MQRSINKNRFIYLPLFKKGEKNSPANYRPISLTSVLCRVLEYILHIYITNHLISQNLLSSIQHGFISNRSTLTQQLQFFEDLTRLQSSKTNCDVIYIDFTKAFDKISHTKLLSVLRHYKLNTGVITWIKGLLEDRSQTTVVENQFSNTCSVTSGVPQGSVLGPLLFILYLESLVRTLEERCTQTKIYAFADDVKLLSTDASDLQNAITVIENWSSKWDLKVQPTKSEHLSFLFSKTVPNTFYINQSLIPEKKNAKDLGLILSTNLTWSKYISTITSKANTTVYTILRAFHYSDYKILINLFKMHVRPILEYNTSIWNPTLISDKTCIENVQKKFTKRLCQRNNIKFNSYLDRLRILNLESLEVRRVKFDIILMFKIFNNLVDVPFKDYFTNSLSATKYNLRGHQNRLQPPKYSGSLTRHNFFTSRIIPVWNKLPKDLINCNTLQIFKSKLNKLDISKFKDNIKFPSPIVK